MTRNIPLRWMPLIACAIVLAACGNKATNDNLVSVKSGMSQAEVKKILGRPDQIETGEILGLSGTTYTYDNKDGSKVQISFIDDHVTVKLGTFQE